MKKLTASCKLLLISLWYKYNYFAKKSKLAKDGSFYYDDKRFSDEYDISGKTIMKAKRRLEEFGYIRYETGRFKGRATKYWVLLKPDKKSSFRAMLKPDNLLPKDDKISLKDPQNVTPNKETTNKINKYNSKLSINEENKQGIKTLAEMYGYSWISNILGKKGYGKDEINKALEG